MKKKIIFHFVTSLRGGPGNVVKDVTKLIEDNYQNYIFTPRGEESENVKKICTLDFYISRLFSKSFESNNVEINTFWPEVICRNKIKKIRSTSKPDYVILYWYKNFVDYKTLDSFKKKYDCRILIYLMDYAPLTGGCHYPFSCKEYMFGCTNCKANNNKLFKNISEKNAKKNKEFFEKNSVEIICPSTISFEDCKKSYITNKLKKHLLILPVKVQESKKNNHFEYNSDTKYILIGAAKINDYNKGFQYTELILDFVYENLKKSKQKLEVIFVGNSEIEIRSKLNYQKLGYVDINELYHLYDISLCFLSTSCEDMGPMMVNQSISRNCPVVSFDVGIAHDLVIPGITGYLSTVHDWRDLASNLLKVINSSEEELNQMKNECKKSFENNISSDYFKKKLIDILEENKNDKL